MFGRHVCNNTGTKEFFACKYVILMSFRKVSLKMNGNGRYMVTIILLVYLHTLHIALSKPAKHKGKSRGC
jgi:hypothetical protein